ncbi:MAG: helix-turn-helix domain-containing protein [Usitatibacteraceae bacterium]
MTRSKKSQSDCPINMALDVLGDAWSLLIVRDLMFKGRDTFKAFLEAEEGIASNVLTDRLRKLESRGIVRKLPDKLDARRNVYRLTEMGIDLAPLMVELVVWSAKNFKTGAPKAVIEQMTGNRSQFLKQIRKNWEAAREA